MNTNKMVLILCISVKLARENTEGEGESDEKALKTCYKFLCVKHINIYCYRISQDKDLIDTIQSILTIKIELIFKSCNKL